MRRKTISFIILALVLFSFIFIKDGLCYRIPPEGDNKGYLYVFGEEGKRSYGAKKEPQVIFLRVPKTYNKDIEVSIYDPDVGGFLDEKSGKWNTKTRFSIFGGERAYSSIAGMNEEDIIDFKEGVLLDVKDFGRHKRYDRKFYHFPPLNAREGEDMGDFRYFKIVAEGLSGNDNNMFSLKISPDIVETFSYALSLRLPERRGAKMELYPEIPKDAKSIIEYNYDLDSTGGSIEIVTTSMAYDIEGSETGVWASTEIDILPGDAGKRWVYEITKDRQPNANMAMCITSGSGVALPVFFAPGPAGPRKVFVEKQQPACNTFTFDASKSYDPDDQELAYFWDFGDGTTSTQLRTMHTYKDEGKYLVRLTVTDNSEADCNDATIQQAIRVNQPPQAIVEGPEAACAGLEVSFDGTRSTDSPEDKLTYRWNFGDGETGEGAKIAHKYLKGGEYQVALTVTDDSGTTCDVDMDRLKLSVNTRPVADAGEDIILCKKNPGDPLKVTFNASASKDADGDSLTYTWDFGDGETGEGKAINHRYEKGGEYIAKLLVTDNTDTDCNRSEATRRITLNRSPMADAGSDMNICLTEKADFNASASIDNDGDTLSYTWDFGDGETASGKKVSYKYSKGGLYKAILNVNDGTRTGCSIASDAIVVDVNSAPRAEVASDGVMCIGESIEFDGHQSSDADGDVLSYAWDFGDGATADGVNAKHTYEKGGLYKAELFVDDGRDSRCSDAIKVHYVNINTPPVANAGSDLLSCVNSEVEFDATDSFDADNDKLTYTWDFGDGVSVKGLKVKHIYKDTGVYRVVLTVKDSSVTECNMATDVLIATVNAEPVPVIEVI